MKKSVLTFLSSFLLLLSCSEEESICYSFDQKSCQGDPWSQVDNNESLTNKISTYLSDQGLEIKNINVDERFHEVVCLACIVCPDGPRIFISISGQQAGLIESLDLLNLEQMACNDQ